MRHRLQEALFGARKLPLARYFASEITPENFAADFCKPIMEASREINASLKMGAAPMRFSGYVSDWDNYLRLFAGASRETVIGEASVCYLWSPSAARNIAARLPDARIIMILRNPVERAWSQYLHCVAAGYTTKSFREQVEGSLRSRSKQFSPLFPFLNLGCITNK